MQESLACGQSYAKISGSRAHLLLKIAEVQIVSRARDFSQLPVWPQLVVESCRPGLGQRLGVFHGDVEFHVIVVHTPEALDDVQLIGVRMADSIEPGLVIKSDRIHDKG
jgi:hypothetical protein